jgi:RimJ/RimL family protein N-acetyltransferase
MNKHELAPTIQSERLSMRSLSKADEAFYCSLYMDPEVMRFVGPPLSREAALEGFRKSLAGMSSPSFERRVVVLIDSATQQPVGISSVRMLRGKPGRAEVGTLLKPGMHEQGFGQECSRALISQAFSRPQIEQLVASSAVGNAVVERLLTELGFSRGDSLPPGNGRPARTAWSISRGDWAKRNAGAKSK